MTTRAWTWWLLGATAAMCGVIALVNALVDPTAQLGTGLLDPVAAGPRDRIAKVALLERGRVPSVVVFGSSRSKKLDPAWLGASGTHGVNAAVVGGDLFEARVLAALLARRVEQRHGTYPRLVLGIDVEQFRDSSLQGSGFLDVPAAVDVARREAGGSSGSASDEVERVGRLLLTWQVTKASAASMRARLHGGVAHATGQDQEPAASADEFNERGVPRGDRAWFGPAVTRLAARTPASIESSIADYRSTYASIGAKLDPDAVDDLRAVLRIAHDAGGPPPLLYVTPAHPRFAAAFAQEGRPQRHDHVLALLHQLGAGGRAIVVDCVSCVDADDRSWIDAIHPSPIGAKQLAGRLARRL
jgi:hypothetical protein